MRLNIYNIFLPCYPSYEAIFCDLLRIRALGFNVIFFNQFLEVDLETSVERTPLESTPVRMSGSLYAPTYRSYTLVGGARQYYVINLENPLNRYSKYSINGSYHEEAKQYSEEGKEKNLEQLEWIKRITSEALRLGMIPIFDLVLGHAAVNCDEEIKKCLDTASRSKDCNDVFSFDYLNKAKFEKAYAELWQPLINWYIDLGFLGVRIDFVFHLETSIVNRVGTFLEQQLQIKYSEEVRGCLARTFHTTADQIRPIIFGEMISDICNINPDSNLDRQDDYERRKSVVIKRLLEERFKEKFRPREEKPKEPVIEFTHGMCWAHELRPLTWYIHGRYNKGDRECQTQLLSFNFNVAANAILAKYGVIGALETHDRPRLQLTCSVCEPRSKIEKEKLIKEKILLTIMVNGGWYLICGNEYGLTLAKQPPFLYEANPLSTKVDKFRYSKKPTPVEKSLPSFFNLSSINLDGTIDLTAFIKMANYFFSYMVYPETEPPIFYFVNIPCKHKFVGTKGETVVIEEEIFLVFGNFSFQEYNEKDHEEELKGPHAPEFFEQLRAKLSLIKRCTYKVASSTYTYIAINLKDCSNVFNLVELPIEILNQFDGTLIKHKSDIARINAFKTGWEEWAKRQWKPQDKITPPDATPQVASQIDTEEIIAGRPRNRSSSSSSTSGKPPL